MPAQIRRAKKEDIQQMLEVYNDFTKEFVGSAARSLNDFRRMLRKKENITFVTLNEQKDIVGYVHARFDKRTRQGEYREIIVAAEHDSEQTARLLVEKVNNFLVEKKATAIVAGSLRNPIYEKIFPTLGFLETESMGVFMYAILDTQKFLHELAPVFAARLQKISEWNGLAQIECEGSSVFLQKTRESVEPLVWANEPADFKVTLAARDVLTKLVFGVANTAECMKASQCNMQTSLNQQKANRLLKTLFPDKKFLIMDFW